MASSDKDEDVELEELRQAALATLKNKPVSTEDGQPIPQVTSSVFLHNKTKSTWSDEFPFTDANMPNLNLPEKVPFHEDTNVSQFPVEFCHQMEYSQPQFYSMPILHSFAKMESLGAGRGPFFRPLGQQGYPQLLSAQRTLLAQKQLCNGLIGQRFPFSFQQQSRLSRPPFMRMSNSTARGGCTTGSNLIVINTVQDEDVKRSEQTLDPCGQHACNTSSGGTSCSSPAKSNYVDAIGTGVDSVVIRPQDRYCPLSAKQSSRQHRNKDKFSRYESSGSDSNDESDYEGGGGSPSHLPESALTHNSDNNSSHAYCVLKTGNPTDHPHESDVKTVNEGILGSPQSHFTTASDAFSNGTTELVGSVSQSNLNEDKCLFSLASEHPKETEQHPMTEPGKPSLTALTHDCVQCPIDPNIEVEERHNVLPFPTGEDSNCVAVKVMSCSKGCVDGVVTPSICVSPLTVVTPFNEVHEHIDPAHGLQHGRSAPVYSEHNISPLGVRENCFSPLVDEGHFGVSSLSVYEHTISPPSSEEHSASLHSSEGHIGRLGVTEHSVSPLSINESSAFPLDLGDCSPFLNTEGDHCLSFASQEHFASFSSDEEIIVSPVNADVSQDLSPFSTDKDDSSGFSKDYEGCVSPLDMNQECSDHGSVDDSQSEYEYDRNSSCDDPSIVSSGQGSDAESVSDSDSSNTSLAEQWFLQRADSESNSVSVASCLRSDDTPETELRKRKLAGQPGGFNSAKRRSVSPGGSMSTTTMSSKFADVSGKSLPVHSEQTEELSHAMCEPLSHSICKRMDDGNVVDGFPDDIGTGGAVHSKPECLVGVRAKDALDDAVIDSSWLCRSGDKVNLTYSDAVHACIDVCSERQRISPKRNVDGRLSPVLISKTWSNVQPSSHIDDSCAIDSCNAVSVVVPRSINDSNLGVNRSGRQGSAVELESCGNYSHSRSSHLKSHVDEGIHGTFCKTGFSIVGRGRCDPLSVSDGAPLISVTPEKEGQIPVHHWLGSRSKSQTFGKSRRSYVHVVPVKNLVKLKRDVDNELEVEMHIEQCQKTDKVILHRSKDVLEDSKLYR